MQYQQLAAFDLRHDAREGLVDCRIEGGIADEIVGNVDLETLVLRDRRREGIHDGVEGWEGAGAEVTAYRVSSVSCCGFCEVGDAMADVPSLFRTPTLPRTCSTHF